MKFKILTVLAAATAAAFISCESDNSASGADTTAPIATSSAEQSSASAIVPPLQSSSGEAYSSSVAAAVTESSSAVVPPVSSSATPVSSSSAVPQILSSSAVQYSSSVKELASSSSVKRSSSSVALSSSAVPSSSSAAEAKGRKSNGCGKALTIKTGFYKITSNGKEREYAIDVPANYDPDKPYRLIYCSHWIWSSAKDVVNGTVTNGGAANWAFFGLKRVLDSAGVQAIFIAPTADGGMWGEADHALFDNLLSYAKTNLCVDTGLVFATGFSFGAMQTFFLSTNHQKDLRAVATLAAANYNIWLPTNTHQKIAYLGITGMSDDRCPFIQNAAQKKGGFYAATLHAEDNGCTVPASINTTYAGSKTHVVYDFQNCDKDYPVRYITFDGGHIAAPTDGQTSDDGRRTWAPHETWKFFSQFK